MFVALNIVSGVYFCNNSYGTGDLFLPVCKMYVI